MLSLGVTSPPKLRSSFCLFSQSYPLCLFLTRCTRTAARESERSAKESAKRFQVNSTIATKTAEDFKSFNDRHKNAKKESIETAKLNKGAGTVVSIHDTAPEFKRIQDDRKAKKKEATGELWRCFGSERKMGILGRNGVN